MSKSNIHKIYVVRLDRTYDSFNKDSRTNQFNIHMSYSSPIVLKHMTNLQKAVEFYNNSEKLKYFHTDTLKFKSHTYEYIRRIIKARGKFQSAIATIYENEDRKQRTEIRFTITPAILE